MVRANTAIAGIIVAIIAAILVGTGFSVGIAYVAYTLSGGGAVGVGLAITAFVVTIAVLGTLFQIVLALVDGLLGVRQ